MFKVGDNIKCINTIGTYSLTYNKTYIVTYSSEYTSALTLINDDNKSYWYDSSKFILDVKLQRKQKLNKICSKKEIK